MGEAGLVTVRAAACVCSLLGATKRRICRNNLFQSFSYCSLSSAMEGCVFKGRHFDRSVILLCIRWYLVYNLSLRNLEEMMAERGISVDHATVHDV